MAPLERLKILMQVQGNERIYTGVWQVGSDPVMQQLHSNASSHEPERHLMDSIIPFCGLFP